MNGLTNRSNSFPKTCFSVHSLCLNSIITTFCKYQIALWNLICCTQVKHSNLKLFHIENNPISQKKHSIRKVILNKITICWHIFSNSKLNMSFSWHILDTRPQVFRRCASYKLCWFVYTHTVFNSIYLNLKIRSL